MRRENRFMKKVSLVVSAIICGTVVALYLGLLVFVRVQVPTGSMYPTISLNDKLLVSRGSDVVRGDIVVFYSEEMDLLLVKRLIGVGGDSVELVSGELFINGEVVDEPYVVNNSYDDYSFEVPNGKCLFLGDNRSSSMDARFWEDTYVEESKIVGKAFFRYYPIIRVGFLDEEVG